MKLLVLIFFVSHLAAQNNCEKVYTLEEVETKPSYGKGSSDLLKSINCIIPLLKDFYEKTGILTHQLYMKGVVRKNGKLTKLKIITPEYLPKNLAIKIQHSLNNCDQKWNPALINNQRVCSEIYIPVSCLRWE